jgi:hypothetical protein
VAGPDVPSPYLAAAPIGRLPPRRRRRWIAPIAATAAVTAVVAVVLTLLIVPVAMHTPESLTVTDGGGPMAASQKVAFPHTGTFDFTWTATGMGPPPMATLTVLDPGGTSVYQDTDSAGGSESLSVGGSGTYTFEVSDSRSVTVSISGTLYFSAPPW